MALTEQQVREKLKSVQDPEVHRDIVTLGAVKAVSVNEAGEVRVRLEPAGGEGHAQLKRDTEAAVRQLGDQVKQVHVEIVGAKAAGVGQGGASGAGDHSGGGAGGDKPNNPLPGVKRIIAVGAGKGGVGKSTIAVNLAVGLARGGAKVGLMDGDIYGPSLPTMLGTDQFQPRQSQNMLIPFELHGIKAMTIGALVDEDKPLIWRGPMAHGAFKQLATQTQWGDLDYLIIDLPPGTGDVPLTMSQLLPLAGAVVVCTPQKVAQDDATRALHMFQQLGIDILGIVENMSYFVGDDGKEYDIFGRGGAEQMAQRLGVPFLGQVPITMALRANADAGDPTANFTEDEAMSTCFESLCLRFQHQIQATEADEAHQGPTLNVH